MTRASSGQRRHGLCTLACATVLAMPALAQPTTPAALPAAGATSATNELGRLFFTPERRQQLDRQREFKVEEKPEPAATPKLTIDGVVTRSSGKRTLWINGSALNDGERADGVVIDSKHRAPGQLVVRPGNAPAIPAKVGDTVDSQTGETEGVLNRGRITVRSGGSE